MLRYLTFKRELVFTAIALIALVAGGIGYYLGERRTEANSAQQGMVNLSASVVEQEKPTLAQSATLPAIDLSAGIEPIRSTGANEDPLVTGWRMLPDRKTSGQGQIRAINGTPFDACVFILDNSTQERVRSVFIRAANSFSFDRVEPGNYRILYTIGTGWDKTNNEFGESASYFEFGRILSFQEQSGMIERYTITLHAVPNGNVQARSLSESEFRLLNSRK